ncbi:hypothetical protein RRG08_061988 [Elysia crispata]|uniref:Uncharacterized protein n=1 Tax=Elysia crispata TaxID=231223 RepID=A0AAE1A3M4_9GAST|nr:hypothetical protein RRG08_061988 [Elysia crispata]
MPSLRWTRQRPSVWSRRPLQGPEQHVGILLSIPTGPLKGSFVWAVGSQPGQQLRQNEDEGDASDVAVAKVVPAYRPVPSTDDAGLILSSFLQMSLNTTPHSAEQNNVRDMAEPTERTRPLVTDLFENFSLYLVNCESTWRKHSADPGNFKSSVVTQLDPCNLNCPALSCPKKVNLLKQ